MVGVQFFIEDLEAEARFLRTPEKEVGMTVLNGERNDNDLRVRRADRDQVESCEIVRLADDEIPGVGAVGAHMEVLFFHRFLSRLMLPPPKR